MNIFIRFGDIRPRTSKSSEIGPNFACFWPMKFFWGARRKILDRHYKIRLSTDHRAKFRAGWTTRLGDFASEKKTSGIKLKSAPQAMAFGRTKKLALIISTLGGVARRISAPRGFCAPKFLHALENDQVLLAHPPPERGPPYNFFQMRVKNCLKM